MTQGSFLRHQALLVKQGLAGQISGLACIRRVSVWSGLCPPGLSNLAAQLWLAGCLIEVIGLHLHAAFLPRGIVGPTRELTHVLQASTSAGRLRENQHRATVDSDHLACTGRVIRDNTGLEFRLGLYYHERGGKAVHASVPTWFERIIC